MTARICENVINNTENRMWTFDNNYNNKIALKICLKSDTTLMIL